MATQKEVREAKRIRETVTPAELVFIDRYLVNFNAAEAWREAFPEKDPKSSKTLGCLALKKPRVAAEIKKRLHERSQAIKVDTYFVIEKLLKVVNADFVDTILEMSKEDFSNIPEEIRTLIKSVKITRKRVGNMEEDTFLVTFMDKDKALEMIGKHTGAFIKDEINVNINMKGFADIVKELYPED